MLDNNIEMLVYIFAENSRHTMNSEICNLIKMKIILPVYDIL